MEFKGFAAFSAANRHPRVEPRAGFAENAAGFTGNAIVKSGRYLPISPPKCKAKLRPNFPWRRGKPLLGRMRELPSDPCRHNFWINLGGERAPAIERHTINQSR
jgi:hypothetical protein